MSMDLNFIGKSLSWSFEGESFEKSFDGYMFYADSLVSDNSRMLAIVARTTIEGKDSFYILNGLGEIIETIYVPESFPTISSLYAVNKTNQDYEIITRSKESKFGRDIALKFSAEESEFISWRESW